jgi:phytoene dehydrogenase-like protein
VEVQFESDYDYWKALRTDEAAYQKEKEYVLEKVIAALERQLPGISRQVETADIATPVTRERYTANWKGSYQGWLPTIKLFGRFLPKTLPGLGRFYMTGQWTFPGGGVPMCMSQARRLVKRVCSDEGKTFKVTLAHKQQEDSALK